MMTKKGSFPSHASPEAFPIGLESFEPMLLESSTLLRQYETDGKHGYRLRVAAALAVDYCKCLLDALGAIVDAPIEESQNLPRKFELIVDRVPRLGTWRSFVKESDALRQLVAHTDHRLSDVTPLRLHLMKAKNFKRDLVKEADRWSKEFSASHELDEQLKAVERELSRLKATFGDYMDAAERGDVYRARLRAFKTLVHSLEHPDDPVISSLLELARGEARTIATFFDHLTRQQQDDFLLSQWEKEQEAESGGQTGTKRRTHSRGGRRSRKIPKS
jgi:hypothetical protein